MKKQRLNLCLFLLIGVLLLAAGTVAAQEKVLVPNFTVTDSSGESVSLSDYRGKVVVLNFWASWCPPCRAEMGELQKLHDELVESGDAVLLMLNQIDGQRETTASGTEYLKKNNYTMRNLFDYGQVSFAIFGVPGLPTTVVIDEEGYLASYVVGPTTLKTVSRMIEEAR
ncbi:MAG TPA: TlpA family protein disulfide reductase [Firmicutes bacterium]|nr:TlpA family protein disulfide reductase [Bacillota bacterium]